MPKLSLRQAADQVGVSKSTILRAIQKGRLSADRKDDGGYAIDPSELMRVYGDRPAQQDDNGAQGQDTTVDGTAALRTEIDGLKAMLELMREQLDDVKDQRDGWQKQAENSQRMLADMRPPARRRWLGFGRAS